MNAMIPTDLNLDATSLGLDCANPVDKGDLASSLVAAHAAAHDALERSPFTRKGNVSPKHLKAYDAATLALLSHHQPSATGIAYKLRVAMTCSADLGGLNQDVAVKAVADPNVPLDDRLIASVFLDLMTLAFEQDRTKSSAPSGTPP